MSAKTTIAKGIRRLGLGPIVDSPALRRLTRTPIYSENEQTSTDSGRMVEHQGPVLTVVVPAYNVEKYLKACLDSILSQSYSNLDVLVVDDGSVDRTADVADSFAAKHKRLRVIHQANAGLGAARNVGLQHSTSEFITFVDSDDIVPPGTYERAMDSLLQTGSDVCISSVSRFDSKNRWVPFWVALAHEEDKYGILGSDFPPIMWDVFAWNKVYRRNTWDRLVGEFPEGTLYEDQECTAKLFVGNARLDILTSVGYNWRLRDDNSSITQQKSNVDDLEQRLNVIRRVRDIISECNSDYVDYWYVKTLGEDLFYYIREIPRASDEFYMVLSHTTRELWDAASEEVFSRIEPVRRLLAYYTAHRSRDSVEELLVHLDRTKNAFRAVPTDDGIAFSIYESEGCEFNIPESLRMVQFDHFKPTSLMDGYSTSPDGDVHFTGYSFIRNLDAEFGLSADLYDSMSDEVVSTLQISTSTGHVPWNLADSYQDYSGCRFTLSIPNFIIDDLGVRLPGSQGNNLDLRLHHHLNGHTWTVDSIKRDLHSSAGYPSASPVTLRGSRIAFQGDPRVDTKVVVLKPRIVARSIESSSGELNVVIDPPVFDTASGSDQHSELFLTASSGGKELCRAPFDDSGSTVSSTLVLHDLSSSMSKTIDRFDLHVVSGSGMRWAIAIDRTQASRRRDQDFAVGMTGYGFAALDKPIQAATADSVTLSPDGSTLSVTGSYYLDPDAARTVTPTFALVGSRIVVHPHTTTVDHQMRTFSARFSLIVNDAEGTSSALQADRYILQLLLATGKSHPASAWVATSLDFEAMCPAQTLTPFHLVTINAVGTSRSVRVDLAAPLDPGSELGRWNQKRNAAVFLAPSRSVSPVKALFESFSGTAVADSPLAIDGEIARRYPDVQRTWTVRDPLTPVPKGARAVVFGSKEWYDAVATSKLLVNNNNFPYFFRKHPDQFYVQTWHGTPLKKIGNHVPLGNLSLSYRELMRREASDHWDVLLAQSAWAGSTLKEAFGFEGTVLNLGYPRNDALTDSTAADAARQRTRRHLGINSEQKVVLYAPTWRDNLKEASGHYSIVDLLNVQNTVKKLGKRFTVLYRGHSNSLNAGRRKLSGRAIDVSTYPNVNDLMLASDVLITDYSSIMFDYVVTGRPIIFLCPDLDEYRDSVRGFYFDFESTAPGPIVRSASEIVDWLRSDQAFSVDSTDRYLSFVNRFANLDDGNASKRVVGQIGHVLT
ncbi:bifunctional glycosyltransferase/CDP-glycerol:glycerophosphate glycerophosphotransferase [Brevibacterium linens]|uniref:bifunctional glycosyltransferase/CDP-glycerol:glycerophosphate glycerophosphotransferase n=1 Tax=Brevibacterium linens TaxID=1703 RepID=UPI000FCBC405|nr:bifunctional glycosyltransferase family 2 protein/CDP-glycerol:glycerophosphate glycerophosphotransferase [Brevibacterium linens]AZT99661.1 hypothetical protein CXR29_02130 [Brevibacterium linens]